MRETTKPVEPFHLDRYIDEQVFRFNNRATKDNPLNDSDRFLLALSQVAGSASPSPNSRERTVRVISNPHYRKRGPKRSAKE
jgi:hypothetical protein